MDNIRNCRLISVDLKRRELDYVHSLAEDTEVPRVERRYRRCVKEEWNDVEDAGMVIWEAARSDSSGQSNCAGALVFAGTGTGWRAGTTTRFRRSYRARKVVTPSER